MNYKVNPLSLECSLAARYDDGTKEYRGKLKYASQEVLKGLFEVGIKGITEVKPTKKTKQVRDNAKNKKEPELKED